MDKERRERIRFRVHGQKRGTQSGEEVLAAVFAQKLGALVRALRAADKIANGANNHDYTIAALNIGSAEAVLAERAAPKIFPDGSGRSGLDVFDQCLDAVALGNVASMRRFEPCLKHLGTLARGSGKVFSYAELAVDEKPPVRVDGLMEDLVEKASRLWIDLDGGNAAATPPTWFQGFAHGSFDGEIKLVDLRGALPQVKLVLTAGRKEIDCILREPGVQQLRETLNRRVRVSGRVFYDGTSGLPRRIEVMSIEAIADGGDVRRWKNSFEPFTQDLWKGDDT
ncbi:hypothetical protein ACE7GA_26420 (plasmid) [Roseomonas sp. CCTCC AB2023176]|uniref:hypothetical protein n=1 Tax=Roseomonas sp. CCTCC AB2023176 TaxID=3342640 RepID=UPI0035DCC96E